MPWLRHESSSQVHSTSRDAAEQTMDVRFNCGGCKGAGKPDGSEFGCEKCNGSGYTSHYRYFDVPDEVYAGVRDAESVGRALHEQIKKAGYRFERVA